MGIKKKPHFENLFKRQNEVLISLALQCNLDDKSRSYMDEYYDTQLRLLNDYFNQIKIAPIKSTSDGGIDLVQV